MRDSAAPADPAACLRSTYEYEYEYCPEFRATLCVAAAAAGRGRKKIEGRDYLVLVPACIYPSACGTEV